MATPLIYSNRLIYRLLMMFLHRKGSYDARYREIIKYVPSGASVVEVCCGDCRLYEHYLRDKGVTYVGLDISEPFVRAAQRSGVDARVFNLWTDDLPKAGVVIMQASLYQFILRPREVLQRLLTAAEDLLIIVEPITNLSASHSKLLSGLSRYLTRPSGAPSEYTGDRFDQVVLEQLFSESPFFKESFILPGGLEMMGIFSKGK